jgi:hypothetical protein
VRSPFIVYNRKIVAGYGEIIRDQPLGDIIRESVVLSRDPFDCQDDFVREAKPEKFPCQDI